MPKPKKDLTYTHGFKVHVPNLLEEITSNALRENHGVLKVPLGTMVRYLSSVAERCSQVNDPVLNRLMCEMALYEEADPSSEFYDRELVEQVIREGAEKP